MIDNGPTGAFENMVVADPRDPSHLVVAGMEEFEDETNWSTWDNSYVSRDGGHAWNKFAIPGGATAGIGHPMATFTDILDPVAAFLPDGSLLYAGTASNYTIFYVPQLGIGTGSLESPSLFVARSEDGGETFSDVQVIERGIGQLGFPIYYDKPWMTVGPDGTALLTYVEGRAPDPENPSPFAGTNVKFTYSTDGGRSWSEPARIYSGALFDDDFTDGETFDGEYLYPAYPAILENGRWLVTAANWARGEVVVATSDDEGRSWKFKTIADKTPGGNTFPTVVRGEVGGDERVFLSYSELVGKDKSRPMVRMSDDGGDSWSRPLAVDAPGKRVWVQQQVAVDDTGTAYFVYYHQVKKDDLQVRVVALTSEGKLSRPLILDKELKGSSGGRSHYIGVVGPGKGAFVTWVTGQPTPGEESLIEPGLDLAGARVVIEGKRR